MSLKNLFLREDGKLSEGRVTSVATFVMWVGITIYLVLNGQTWGHYEGFSAICLGYGVRQYFNKKTEINFGMTASKQEQTYTRTQPVKKAVSI